MLKRLTAAMIDLIICFFLFCILRALFAAIQKAGLERSGSYILHTGQDYQIYVEFLIFLFLILLFLFYWYVSKRHQDISPGKKIMGLRVESGSGKWYGPCHNACRAAAFLFLPLTVTFYFLLGRMPYDRLLKIKVDTGSREEKNRYPVFRKILAVCSVPGLLFFALRFGLFPLFFCQWVGIAWADAVAGTYTAAIEVPFEKAGERALQEGEGGETCRYIFSEEGERGNWCFTMTDRGQYLEAAVKNGYGLKELEEFDFDKNILVCSFGRRLETLRLLDRESLYLLPELGRGYERGAVFYYRVPRIEVVYPYECPMQQGGAGKLYVEGTDFRMLKEGRAEAPVIAAPGPFRNWLWALRREL